MKHDIIVGINGDVITSDPVELSATGNTTLTNCTFPAPQEFCWQPWTTITYPPNLTFDDVSIRKVKNGYVAKFQGTEMVFETIESLNKQIKEFYKEKKK